MSMQFKYVYRGGTNLFLLKGLLTYLSPLLIIVLTIYGRRGEAGQVIEGVRFQFKLI